MLAVGIFFWRWIICDAMHAAFRELWPRKVHYSGSVIEDCMETLLRNADVSPLLGAPSGLSGDAHNCADCATGISITT